MAAVPIDDADRLPALRFAWRSLGQAPAALEGCTDVAGMLAAMRAAFSPARIPATSVALHNTGVAFEL